MEGKAGSWTRERKSYGFWEIAGTEASQGSRLELGQREEASERQPSDKVGARGGSATVHPAGEGIFSSRATAVFLDGVVCCSSFGGSSPLARCVCDLLSVRSFALTALRRLVDLDANSGCQTQFLICDSVISLRHIGETCGYTVARPPSLAVGRFETDAESSGELKAFLSILVGRALHGQ